MEVIKVENLSKRYRIGLKENYHDSISSLVTSVVKYPIKNFRNLIKLSNFNEDDEDVFWALRDIEFSLHKGEVLGIIGKNGAGKSTLLKILSRITEPTSGSVKIKGRVAALLEVGTGFHPEMTGRENVYLNGTVLGMSKKEVDVKFDEIVEFSGITKFIDTPVKRYSSGMKVRLGFAVAAHLDPEVLIVDEVLAVGDAEFQKKCLGKMNEVANDGRTVLFVSHNMGAVTELCDKAILLENGKIVKTGTSPEVVSYYLRTNLKNDNPILFTPEPDQAFCLDAIHFLDNQKNLRSKFEINEAVEIQVDFTVNSRLENFRLNIAVHKEAQILFFTRLTDDLQELYNFDPGKYSVSFKIRPYSLKADEYTISVIGMYPGGGSGEKLRKAYDYICAFSMEETSLNMEHIGYARKRKGLMIPPGNWIINS